jgi:hypothetical protein
MRAGVAIAAVAATVVVGAYLWPSDVRRTAAAARATASYPPPLVACDAVVLRPRRVSPGDRVVFGRVAFVGARVYQVADVGGDGSFRLFAKIGLYVRAGTPTFTLAVPQHWRRRAGIAWGTGIEPAVRIAGCPLPPLVWNGYAGGFYVPERACVPLIVRVGGRQTVLRFAIGRPCAGG